MIGCGMQQAREAPPGENRWSREERQERNEWRLWQAVADAGKGSFETWNWQEWTGSVAFDGGDLWQPQERSPERVLGRREDGLGQRNVETESV